MSSLVLGPVPSVQPVGSHFFRQVTGAKVDREKTIKTSEFNAIAENIKNYALIGRTDLISGELETLLRAGETGILLALKQKGDALDLLPVVDTLREAFQSKKLANETATRAELMHVMRILCESASMVYKEAGFRVDNDIYKDFIATCKQADVICEEVIKQAKKAGKIEQINAANTLALETRYAMGAMNLVENVDIAKYLTEIGTLALNKDINALIELGQTLIQRVASSGEIMDVLEFSWLARLFVYFAYNTEGAMSHQPFLATVDALIKRMEKETEVDHRKGYGQILAEMACVFPKAEEVLKGYAQDKKALTAYNVRAFVIPLFGNLHAYFHDEGQTERRDAIRSFCLVLKSTETHDKVIPFLQETLVQIERTEQQPPTPSLMPAVTVITGSTGAERDRSGSHDSEKSAKSGGSSGSSSSSHSPVKSIPSSDEQAHSHSPERKPSERANAVTELLSDETTCTLPDFLAQCLILENGQRLTADDLSKHGLFDYLNMGLSITLTPKQDGLIMSTGAIFYIFEAIKRSPQTITTLDLSPFVNLIDVSGLVYSLIEYKQIKTVILGRHIDLFNVADIHLLGHALATRIIADNRLIIKVEGEKNAALTDREVLIANNGQAIASVKQAEKNGNQAEKTAQLLLELRYKVFSLCYRSHTFVDNEGRAYFNIGIVASNLGQLAQAAIYFATANKVRPNHLATLYNLAETYIKQGLFQQAKLAIMECLSLDPNDQDTLALEQHILTSKVQA